MLKTILVALAFVLPLVVSAAAEETRPPAWLIEAIARQESSLNPLAVNVAGKDYYPATRQEVEAIIAAAQASGKSFDVGLFQINRWWMERHNIPPASLFDPEVSEPRMGRLDIGTGNRPARLQLAGRGKIPFAG